MAKSSTDCLLVHQRENQVCFCALFLYIEKYISFIPEERKIKQPTGSSRDSHKLKKLMMITIWKSLGRNNRMMCSVKDCDVKLTMRAVMHSNSNDKNDFILMFVIFQCKIEVAGTHAHTLLF